MEKLCQKLNIKITALTWTTQSGYFNTIEKVNNDFPLPKYSATLFLMWKCQVDNSSMGSVPSTC